MINWNWKVCCSLFVLLIVLLIVNFYGEVVFVGDEVLIEIMVN